MPGQRPDERWQNAKDLTDQLKWITDGSAQAAPLTAAAEGRARMAPRWALISGFACLAAAVIAAFAAWSLKPTPRQVSPPLARLAITLPPGEQLVASESDAPMALSPDGTRLVYVVRRSGSPQLYMRQIDEFDFAPIPGTEGASAPFFSPDSQWIGFSSVGEKKLKKVYVGGGAPQNVCDISLMTQASWGPNDQIIFSQSGADGLYRVSAAGGKPEVLTTPDSQRERLLMLGRTSCREGRRSFFRYTATRVLTKRTSFSRPSIRTNGECWFRAAFDRGTYLRGTLCTCGPEH